MSDLLLLAGIALCVLSLVFAVIAMLRLQPPRRAAASFVFGIMIIGIAAWVSPDGLSVADIGRAWQRFTGIGG